MPSQDFDFQPVFDKMLALYRARTEKMSIDDMSPEYRVRWSEVFVCMQEHGYAKSIIEGRTEWHEVMGEKFNRACRKIDREFAN